jgi:hypothetical protein
MSGFADDIVGGGGNLIRKSIQSPNFSLTAKTGWAILKNGDAFFFNVTASGLVTANSVIVSGTGDGVFIYDGLPAHNSLVVSIAAAAGTDGFSNAYSGPGISVSAPGPTGKNEIQIRPDKRAIFVYADS